MKEFLKQRKLECILVFVLLIFMGAVTMWSLDMQKDYEHYNNDVAPLSA